MQARAHGGHGLVKRSATDNDAARFGGYKQSGFGPPAAGGGVSRAFQETKHVPSVARSGLKEWW